LVSVEKHPLFHHVFFTFIYCLLIIKVLKLRINVWWLFTWLRRLISSSSSSFLSVLRKSIFGMFLENFFVIRFVWD
jgi:hypothetical protein